MRKALFRSAAIAAAVALFTGVALANQLTTPDWFPAGFNLDSSAYTLRFAGDDRYETAGTISLIHSTATEGDDYPFNEVQKEDRFDTWGLNECNGLSVEGIGVAAGDTSADALAASPAKDLAFLPAGLSVTDPTDAVATLDDAYMLLQTSIREGATTLNPDFIAAVDKMQAETTCDDFDFVVFGGSEAISTEVYDDLNTLNGTGDVFVIGGVDRYETAAKVAKAVHNGIDGAPGDSPTTADLPELDHYPTAAKATQGGTPSTTPDTLTDVVFLAEGTTGADALTIGPVAAANNVPLVLTQKDSLPSFTATALADLDPATIVVLGGDEAISPTTRAAAAAAAPGAETVIVIAGADRYATSVEISEQLYGYYGENQDGNEFENLAIGFGRSEGAGAAFVGWPDVLSSAWFLDEYDDNQGSTDTPFRMAPDVEKNEDYLFIGEGFWSNQFDDNDHDTPLLVVQQASVPGPVNSYLASLWTDTDVDMCTADPEDSDPTPIPGEGPEWTCNNEGGFGFLFGGTAAISASAELTLAGHLSGGTYGTTDLTPVQNNALVFFTELSFTSYDPSDENGGGPLGETGFDEKICWYRNALTGSQFIAVYETDGDHEGDDEVDYQNTGTAFPRYQSRFWCEDGPDGFDTPANKANAFGVSLSGHRTAVKAFDYSSDSLTLENLEDASDATADGLVGDTDGGAFVAEDGNGETATTTYTFSGTGWSFRHKTTTEDVDWQLTGTISRKDPAGGDDGGTTGDNEDRITFTGTLTIDGATIPPTTFALTMEGFMTTPAVGDSTIWLSGMYSIGGVLGGVHFNVTGDGTTTGDLQDLEINGNA